MPNLIPQLVTLLPEDLRTLIEQAPLPNLQGTLAQPSLRGAILQWEESLRSNQPKSQFRGELKDLILAALWLLEGDLDQSHNHSQKWETLNGNYWHAIMHRREKDFSNAKYWYRRVEKHPIVMQLKQRVVAEPELGTALRELDQALNSAAWLGSWVDVNQKVIEKRSSPELKSAVLQLAWLEWQLLLAHCIATAR